MIVCPYSTTSLSSLKWAWGAESIVTVTLSAREPAALNRHAFEPLGGVKACCAIALALAPPSCPIAVAVRAEQAARTTPEAAGWADPPQPAITAVASTAPASQGAGWR